MNVHNSFRKHQAPLLARLRHEATVKRRPRPARTAREMIALCNEDRGPAPLDLSADQQQVYDEVLSWYRNPSAPLTLGGFAGTGKTTLIAALARELEKKTQRGIAFCAFTGKAASVLNRKLADAGVQASRTDVTRNYVGTIHSLIYEPELGERGEVRSWKKRGRSLVEDQYALIVVDEASMVSDDLFEDLASYGLPVLAVGDHGQLTPVDGFGSLMADPMLRLEQVHRHALDNPILRLSLEIREKGDLPAELPREGAVRQLKGPEEVAEVLAGLYARSGDWDENHDYLDPLDVVSLTYTNRTRRVINGFCRDLLHRQDTSALAPRAGDQLICLKNQSGVYNGMRGTIESDVAEEKIWYKATSYFPDDGLEVTGSFLKAQLGRDRTFGDVQELNEAIRPYEIKEWSDAGLLFDYGYAMTVHKSQGSQFRHVFLFYERIGSVPRDDFRRWLYTAATRATDRLYIVSG